MEDLMNSLALVATQRVPWDHAIRTASNLPCSNLEGGRSGPHVYYTTPKKAHKPSRKASNKIGSEDRVNSKNSVEGNSNAKPNNESVRIPQTKTSNHKPDMKPQTQSSSCAVGPHNLAHSNQGYTKIYEVNTTKSGLSDATSNKVGATSNKEYCSTAAPATKRVNYINAASPSTASASTSSSMSRQNCDTGASSTSNQANSSRAPPVSGLSSTNYPLDIQISSRLAALERQNAQLLAYQYYLSSQMYAATIRLNSLCSSGVPLTPPSLVPSPNDPAHPYTSVAGRYAPGSFPSSVSQYSPLQSASNSNTPHGKIREPASKKPHNAVPRASPKPVINDNSKPQKTLPREQYYYYNSVRQTKKDVGGSRVPKIVTQHIPQSVSKAHGQEVQSSNPKSPARPGISIFPAVQPIKPARGTLIQEPSPVCKSVLSSKPRHHDHTALQPYPKEYLNRAPRVSLSSQEKLPIIQNPPVIWQGVQTSAVFRSSSKSSSPISCPRRWDHITHLEHFPIDEHEVKYAQRPDELVPSTCPTSSHATSSTGSESNYNAEKSNSSSNTVFFHVLKPVFFNSPPIKERKRRASLSGADGKAKKPRLQTIDQIPETDDTSDNIQIMTVEKVRHDTGRSQSVSPRAKSVPTVNSSHANAVIHANNSFAKQVSKPSESSSKVQSSKPETAAAGRTPEVEECRSTKCKDASKGDETVEQSPISSSTEDSYSSSNEGEQNPSSGFMAQRDSVVIVQPGSEPHPIVALEKIEKKIN